MHTSANENDGHSRNLNWMSRRNALVRCLLASCCLYPAAAAAQSGSGSSAAFQTVDTQEVDVGSGNLNVGVGLLSIGNDDGQIEWNLNVRGNITADDRVPTLSTRIAEIDASTSTIYLKTDATNIPFTFDKYVNGVNSSGGTVYKPNYKRFGQLFKYTIPTMSKTFSTSSGSTTFSTTIKFVYVDRDGAEYTFFYFGELPNGRKVDNIQFPNGNIEKYNYDYLNGSYASHDIQNAVISVENSYGMQLKNLNHHAYVSRTGYQDATVTAVALNKGYIYCDPTVYACTVPAEWQRISIYDKYTINSNYTSVNDRSFQLIEATNPMLSKTVFNFTGLGSVQRVKSFSRPGPSGTITKNLTYNTNANGFYSTVASLNYFDPGAGVSRIFGYTYTSSSTAGTMTTSASDPLGQTSSMVTSSASGLPTTVTDKNGVASTYVYDPVGNLTSVTKQDGSSTTYNYDDRGNVIDVAVAPATGSSLSIAHTRYGYDAVCANNAKCNKPNWTRDAADNETNFTYTAEGFLESVTGPASSQGVRPQIRYAYIAMQAYYLNSSGVVGASGQSIKLLWKTSQCRNGAGAPVSGTPGQGPFALAGTASCAGTADEQVEVVDYGPQQAGVVNNLWPVKRTLQSGDGSLVSSVEYSYDKFGNVASEDGPLSGTADKTVYVYDSNRRVTGVIGADPDGSTGPRKNSALRYVYGSDGQVTSSSVGTVTSQTDTSFSTFAPINQTEVTYDLLGRRIISKSLAGGTVMTLAQYSYDALGRVDCVATRMNSAAWGSLPTSACAPLAAGSAGPDRIMKYAYNKLDLPTTVTVGLGTSEQADLSAATYTNNGQVETLSDAKGNLTTYQYDGFGRLLTATYAGGSYEQFGYDGLGRISSRRLRDGTSIGYGHDNLGRVVSKTLPNGEGTASYSYDLLGHVLTTVQGSTLSYVWDALGRMTQATQPYGAMSYLYDSAGNRIRTTWPDGFYVAYVYDWAGNLTSINNSAGSPLLTFGYDDLGRRTSLTRGSGPSTSYSYDTSSRLWRLTNDVAGTAETTTFSYNPANQITTADSTDDHQFTEYFQVSRPYSTNALNQYTSAGAVNFAYDARGNLTNSGASTFTFSSENRLKTASGSLTMQYDPAGRLTRYDVGSALKGFVYDGGQITAEVNPSTGAISKRYVLGPSADEPLVEYDAAGTATYLVADERGSITIRTNSSGAVTARNSFDEAGIPGSANVGLFQYTGQAWLSELGMSYYKARVYSPTLGRFLQTDPLGYKDGINWYTYANNDPVNGRDPSGTSAFFLFLPPAAYYVGRINFNSAYFQSYLYDTIVVTAYINNGFSGGGAFNFNQFPLEPLYYGYPDGSTQDSKTQSVDTVDNCNRPITETKPTVKPDPSKKLAFITHLHQGDPTPENILAGLAHFAFPGPYDGNVPALRQIPSYVLSKVGVTVVRPGLIPGTVSVEKLTPGGFDASDMPPEALRALQANAMNAYNARNNPSAPKVNPCQ